VNIHETARLKSVPPNLDLGLSRQLGRNHLPAYRCRSLFPPAVVGALRAVHVVVSRHARRDAEVFPEMAAHTFAEELLPAVAVLRHRGVSIAFSERHHVLR